MKQLLMKWIGNVPLLMHSNLAANPLSPMSRLMKAVTSNRKKEESHHLCLSDLEWCAGVYTDIPLEIEQRDLRVRILSDSRVVLPERVVNACLRKAAAKKKLGTDFKAAVWMEELFTPLQTFEANGAPGPALAREMFARPDYRDMRMVRVQAQGVLRTRPVFHRWEAIIPIAFMEDIVPLPTLCEVAQLAGSIIGIGDNRPINGRFRVEFL